MLGSFGLRWLWGDGNSALSKFVTVGLVLSVASLGALTRCHELWSVSLMLFLLAAGQALVWVSGGSLVHLEVERRFHGRVLSLQHGATMAMLALSSFAGGCALDAGASLMQVVGGFAVVATAPTIIWVSARQRWGR